MANDLHNLNESRELALWKGRTRAVFGASWPNAITFALLGLRFLIDTYYLGRIGVFDQGAFGTGLVMMIMCLSFAMGALFAVNSAVSKCVGKRWYATCGNVVWQGIWFSVICGIGVLGLYFAAPFIFSLFGHEPAVQALEIDYFQVALNSTIFQLVSWTVIHFFIAIGRPFVPIIIAAVTLIAHVFAGSALVLGNFGFTSLGIVGSAWALVFSSLVMAITALLFLTVPRSLRKYHTRWAKPRWRMFRRVVGEGAPIGGRQILDEFVWNVVLIWIIGQFGVTHLAAAAVLITVLDVFILTLDSIGMTCVAFIGKAIGSYKVKKANNWRIVCLAITCTYAFAAGLLFYIFREPAVRIFAASPEVEQLAISLAFVVPLFLIVYAIYSTYDHALSATDDNGWPSTVSLISSVVFLGAGGVLLVLKFPEWESYGAWGLVLVNIFVVAVAFAFRWTRNHWHPEPRPE